MTRLTILPVDGAVYEDDVVYDKLDFSSCGIPADLHALHWDGSAGHIEFTDLRENEEITELPNWVNACIAKRDEYQAAEKAYFESEAGQQSL